MLIRRHRFAYLGLGAIVIWTILTYYLAVYRPPLQPYKPLEMPEASDRASILLEKIEKLSKELAAQKAENEQLLESVKNLNRPAGNGGNLATTAVENGRPSHASTTDSSQETAPPVIAVLVIACNRPSAITNHLDQLLKLRPSKELFPVIVSQDCRHEETTEAIRRYGDQIIFIQQPDQSDIVVPVKQKKFVGYYKISRHYHWALNQTFYTYGFNATIVTEDDLDISTDFFEYFSATFPLLERDPSLWCVSAWNDNGKAGMIEQKADLLYRTDFFPGLGWMLRRSLWDELEPIWPAAYWDDWMRRAEVRKNRACIRPEISRTAMSSYGKTGVSKGLFFEKHLKNIKLNTEKVLFSKMDLFYLLKDNYDVQFVKEVYSCPSITQAELAEGKFLDGKPLPNAVRLTYEEKNTYKNTAKAYKLMDDFRAGVPRTAYRGVVPFMYGKFRVYLAPVPEWSSYDPTWS